MCVYFMTGAPEDSTESFYAPNFEKVEGAYCFGLVCPSVRASVRPFVRPLQKLSYIFGIFINRFVIKKKLTTIF